MPSDAVFKLFAGIHRTAFNLTKGRLGGTVAGMPVVKLTTTGRKSGKQHDTMLTSPLQDGDKVMLVASKGGAAKHPAWYLNLRDNPAVVITMQGRTRPMTARTASAAQKAELMPQIVEAYKGYGDYQDRTERDIPVIVLEPST